MSTFQLERNKNNLLMGLISGLYYTCKAGAQASASVKQIMHISSASCFKVVSDEQPCRHGRHVVSPNTPPHMCPQLSNFKQAVLAYS